MLCNVACSIKEMAMCWDYFHFHSSLSKRSRGLKGFNVGVALKPDTKGIWLFFGLLLEGEAEWYRCVHICRPPSLKKLNGDVLVSIKKRLTSYSFSLYVVLIMRYTDPMSLYPRYPIVGRGWEKTKINVKQMFVPFPKFSCLFDLKLVWIIDVECLWNMCWLSSVYHSQQCFSLNRTEQRCNDLTNIHP